MSRCGVLLCSKVSVRVPVNFHTGTRSMVSSKLGRFQPLSNVNLYKQCGVAVNKKTLIRICSVVRQRQGAIGSRALAAIKLNTIVTRMNWHYAF